MSSTISGTQSPPLEATGEEKPMGASSVDKIGEKIEAVKDIEQRKEYFQASKDEDANKQPLNRQKVGESLADKFDKST